MSAAHRHSFVPIDGTLFAASAAQPGVLVCLEDGVQQQGIDRERLARALDGIDWSDHMITTEVTEPNAGYRTFESSVDMMAFAAAIADRYEADDE